MSMTGKRRKATALLVVFFVLFVLSGKSGAAGAGAAVRPRIPAKTACGISLAGAAQREPLRFSSVVSADADRTSYHYADAVGDCKQ